MSINKLPVIKNYWECGQVLDNEDIKNFMARSKFEDMLESLHLSDNTNDDVKSDRSD